MMNSLLKLVAAIMLIVATCQHDKLDAIVDLLVAVVLLLQVKER